MKCQEIREQILESALSNRPMLPEVQEHTGTCPSCREQWESMRGTMALLDAWEAPEPSPFFDTRLYARLRSEAEAAPMGWRERLKTAMAIRRPVGWRPLTAVALGLAMAAGIGFYERNQPSAPPQTASSAVVDLQELDKNQELLNDMSALDQTVESPDAATNE